MNKRQRKKLDSKYGKKLRKNITYNVIFKYIYSIPLKELMDISKKSPLLSLIDKNNDHLFNTPVILGNPITFT